MFENKTLKKYADELFTHFKGIDTPNKGLYLWRVVEARFRKTKRPIDEMVSLKITLINLIENDYLILDDQTNFYSFTRITEKGVSYLNGGPLLTNTIDLKDFINLNEDLKVIFSDLWAIIGVEGKAPFYIPDSYYYKSIVPYVKGIDDDFNKFLFNRKAKTLSLSRYDWYAELLYQVPIDELSLFLADLSSTIQNIYKKCYMQETVSLLNGTSSELANSSTLIDKRVFISYCWESEEHQAWVHKLYEDLNNILGIHPLLDQELPLGKDLTLYMEEEIMKADKVLLVLTPEYKKRADGRIKGVGYESYVITADLQKKVDTIKFIPIMRIGSKEECYPVFLGNRNGLDMRNDDCYDDHLTKLIKNIFLLDE